MQIKVQVLTVELMLSHYIRPAQTLQVNYRCKRNKA